MPYSKTRKIIQRGLRSAQPLASSVQEGSLYRVTDEGITERSNGTIWESFSDLIVRPGFPLPIEFEESEERIALPTSNILLPNNWIDEPFDAADYSGSGAMTWTVDAAAVAFNKWKFLDAEHKTIIWFIYVKWFAGTSTLGGTADTQLRIQLPNGLGGPTSQVNVVPVAVDNGVTKTAAEVFSETIGAQISIRKFSGANWTLGTQAGVIFTTILAVD